MQDIHNTQQPSRHEQDGQHPADALVGFNPLFSSPTSGQEWEEQFEQWFPITHPEAGIDKYGPFIKVNPERVKDFIRKAIQEAEKRGQEKERTSLRNNPLLISDKGGTINITETIDQARREAQQELIEAIQTMKKEIPEWADYESAAEDLGYNQAIDDVVTHLRKLAKGER